MQTPRDSQPRRSVRMDAGLDAQTRAKLERLATGFQCSWAAVLRQVMQWGLGQTGPVAPEVPRRITSCFFMVDAALHQQVKAAAQAAGIDVAPWMRHMMRQRGSSILQAGRQAMPLRRPWMTPWIASSRGRSR